MSIKHKRGVDSAIAILEELLAHGTVRSAADLAKSLSIPRTTFYRIVRILETQGVLCLKNGLVRLGPFSAALLTTYVSETEHAEKARWRRVGAPATLVTAETELGREARPMRLLRPPPSQSGRKLRIGVAIGSISNPWRIALVHTIEAAASSHGTELAKLDIRCAEDDLELQIEQIHALIDADVDGLIISSLNDVARLPLERARLSGIPVILLEQPGTIEDCCSISVNDWMMGKTAALWIAETIGGRGNIIMLSGQDRAPHARLRLEAARSVFDRHPRIKLIAHAWTGWDREAARRYMNSTLARYGGEVSAVWSDSGMQAVGSIEAFAAAGYEPGRIPPHTGGDINHFYKLANTKKVAAVGLNNPPAMGLHAVEALMDCLKGKWIPARIEVPSEIIVSKGHETASVRADSWIEDHVRWDQPNELIMASGIGRYYNPRSFRVRYPGNRYNRSAAQTISRVAS